MGRTRSAALCDASSSAVGDVGGRWVCKLKRRPLNQGNTWVKGRKHSTERGTMSAAKRDHSQEDEVG
eukprot:586169-Rhodomonas_salina.1